MAGKKSAEVMKQVEFSTDTYEVGYKKPPKHTQFKKGISGNVGGRRKGSLGLQATMKKVFDQKIKITVNGKAKLVPALEAMTLQLSSAAIRGDLKALKVVYDLLRNHKLETPKDNVQLEALFQALMEGPVENR